MAEAKVKRSEKGKEKSESKLSNKKTSAEKAKPTKVKSNENLKEIDDGNTEEVIQIADDAAEERVEKEVTKTAKAGKRSTKAIKEAEQKEAKEARKVAQSDETAEKSDSKPQPHVKPARSRLERRSKGYRKVHELIEKGKTYELKEGLEVAVKTNPVKFDATVELHINLGVDPRQADQNIRGTVVLPSGTGKSARVAVFADDEDAKKAKAAGADIAASDDFLKQLDKGTLDFDVLISTPTNMAKLGKYARVLGPKGLMPNPKSGTVTTDVAKAVKEAKAGRVEYRVDSTGIIHVGVGKVSFGADKLEQNIQALTASIKTAKPSSIKGNYIKSSYLTTSMGPSLKINL